MTAAHRRPTVVAAATAALLLTLLPAGAIEPASTGSESPSSGVEPVVAEDRSDLERLAEGYATRAHNDQRTAADPTTRNGVTYGDVDGGAAMQPWTDILTVARWWSDRIGLGDDDFFHNPDYGDQYGHWRGAGENIAAVTLGLVEDGPPTEQAVLDGAERIMQNWWESDGHRVNWMNDGWDHFAVGADIDQVTYCSGERCWDFHELVLTTNFRRSSSTPPDPHRAFAADGSPAPQEASTADETPVPTPRDVADTCPEASRTFADVPSNGLFRDTIACLAHHDITQGFADGRYRPAGSVTVEQIAAFARRTVARAGASTSVGGDVCPGLAGVLAEDVAWAVANGLLLDGTDGTPACDRSTERIDRGEMARFVAGGLDVVGAGADATTADWFSDDDGHPFEDDIQQLAELGVVVGSAPGRFAPDAGVTRGQMSRFLAAMLDRALDVDGAA